MEICPDCNSKLQDYFDKKTGFSEYLCWRCGFYASNSPAYRSNPRNFKNMVRENPVYFMKRYAHQPTGNTHNTTEEGTEPAIRFFYLLGCCYPCYPSVVGFYKFRMLFAGNSLLRLLARKDGYIEITHI